LYFFGGTGNGKSTISNRLLGDNSEKGDKGEYKVSGDSHSCTGNVKGLTVVLNDKQLTYIFDTPGLDDSKSNSDVQHIQNMIEYFSHFSIHPIIIVMPVNMTNPRFDKKIQDHLKLAHAIFGNILWDNFVLVATRVDLPNLHDITCDELLQYKIKEYQAKQAQFSTYKKQIAEHFVECFQKDGVTKLPPIIQFGINNYCNAVVDLFEISHKAKPFDCEVVRKLHSYQCAQDLYTKWQAGNDLSNYVLERSKDQAQKENLKEALKKSSCIIL